MRDRTTIVRVARALEKPDRILKNSAYWNVPFLERFLDRCDDVAVHEPMKAYLLTEPVITLADSRIEVAGGARTYESRQHRRSYRVRARTVRAAAAKYVGFYDEAEHLYRRAFALTRKPVDESVRARLYIGYGWFLLARGERRALSLAERLHELSLDTLTRASALVLLGASTFLFAPPRSGLDCFARAALLSKEMRGDRRGRRIFYAALHGMAKVLSESLPTVAGQREAYNLLEEVRGYLAGRPKSVAKMLIYAQMGRIAWNLGLTRHGPRLLAKARKGFLDLGELHEFALSSLDLAGCYRHLHMDDGYKALAAETHDVLENAGNQALFETISPWSRNVRAPGALRDVRRAVEQAGGGSYLPPDAAEAIRSDR